VLVEWTTFPLSLPAKRRVSFLSFYAFERPGPFSIYIILIIITLLLLGSLLKGRCFPPLIMDKSPPPKESVAVSECSPVTPLPLKI